MGHAWCTTSRSASRPRPSCRRAWRNTAGTDQTEHLRAHLKRGSAWRFGRRVRLRDAFSVTDRPCCGTPNRLSAFLLRSRHRRCIELARAGCFAAIPILLHLFMSDSPRACFLSPLPPPPPPRLPLAGRTSRTRRFRCCRGGCTRHGASPSPAHFPSCPCSRYALCHTMQRFRIPHLFFALWASPRLC